MWVGSLTRQSDWFHLPSVGNHGMNQNERRVQCLPIAPSASFSAVANASASFTLTSGATPEPSQTGIVPSGGGPLPCDAPLVVSPTMVARFSVFRSYVKCSPPENVRREVRTNTCLLASRLPGTGERVTDSCGEVARGLYQGTG